MKLYETLEKKGYFNEASVVAKAKEKVKDAAEYTKENPGKVAAGAALAAGAAGAGAVGAKKAVELAKKSDAVKGAGSDLKAVLAKVKELGSKVGAKAKEVGSKAGSKVAAAGRKASELVGKHKKPILIASGVLAGAGAGKLAYDKYKSKKKESK